MKPTPSTLNFEPRTLNFRSRGIALVITLLMLSVITFLAVAFLVMTRRDTSSKNATLDVSTAESMSEAGLARAQAEIIARMMVQADVLAYDYMVSSNYINPLGYAIEAKGLIDTNNVNYDFYSGSPQTSFGLTANTANDWAQNIANLMFDPRPPVFVFTNTDPTKPASDFRYYVDLNRNGAFEGSSYRTTNTADRSTLPVISNTSGQQGEPEWIGVLADPTHPHSKDNQFVGRYAYMVLPIGKTLDLNFIHNESQNDLNGATPGRDEFVRDQGVGSWELNLGGYFRELNTNIYGEAAYVAAANRYRYILPNTASRQASFNEGFCFDDARSIFTNRFIGEGVSQSVLDIFGNVITTQMQHDGIDEYATSPITNLNGPFDFTTSDDPEGSIGGITAEPWPGSYNTRMLYDMQEVFDPTRTSANFTNRLAVAGGRGGSPNYPTDVNRILYDRYTYQRMLATIGTGSEPEYGVYLYTNEIATNQSTPPTWLKTKMNLNYDNSVQMVQGPYSPMPTNPIPWSDPLKFFTNAADLLLRTQDFPVTNYTLGRFEYHHFGLSTMYPSYPIYCPTNPSYRYTPQLHRMLQLAANLYDATLNTNWYQNGTNIVHFPSVFRPVFFQSNNGCVYIIGYSNVSAADVGLPSSPGPNSPLRNPWYYLTNTTARIPMNANIYGVPWVVGAVQGLPSFNEMSQATGYGMVRKLQFVRPDSAQPTVLQTNQQYFMSISNRFGIEVWNSYNAPFVRPVYIMATNVISIIFTNNSRSRPCGETWSNGISTNFYSTTIFPGGAWPGKQNAAKGGSRSFVLPLLTNSDFFPLQKYLDSAEKFLSQSDPTWDVDTFTVHGWSLAITNTMTYIMQDVATGAILDFVNLGPVGTYLNVTNELNRPKTPVGAGFGTGAMSFNLIWKPDRGSDTYPGFPQYFSLGASNQVLIGEGYVTVQDWNAQAADMTPSEFLSTQQEFADFLSGKSTNEPYKNDPFQPNVVLAQITKWQANDPLVHYTVEDLTGPGGTSNYTIIFNPAWQPATLPDNLGKVNERYSPWPANGSLETTGLQDAQITNSDAWRFPTNKFPSVGWIGRVHRGTPWQTIYLKADPLPGSALTSASNPGKWVSQWVGDLSPGLILPGASYPTNDWALLDLFTTAPNDNALRGTLSVNQTNLAPWHALLDGVVAFTNTPQGTIGVSIDPTVSYGTNANVVSYIMDSADGINTVRTNWPGGIFHHIGDILAAPALTVLSPFINPDQPPGDEVMERIPQQIASLLKVGQPQFVIYAWGQSLRPQSLYNPLTGTANLFKLCTNYAITGEFLTRTVCHLDLTKSDRFGTNAHIQIDSFNILPAAQ